MTQRLLLALDTASLYFRAFHGVPDDVRRSDGTPVNAVRGLLDMIATLVDRYRPDAVVAAWDNDWRPQWRVDLVASYKTHRVVEEPAAVQQVVGAGGVGAESGEAEATPDALAAQLPGIIAILDALGVPIVGVDGYEADDVLASLAAKAEAADWRCVVVTGDRDLFQLVDESTSVSYVGRGVARHELVDDEWLAAKYGVIGAQYVDFATMRGDPSDGLPGVAGVGEKTAASLLREHGDLAGIIEAAGDEASVVGARVRSKLIDAADYLVAAQEVVRCVVDLPVPGPDELVVDRAGLDQELLTRLAGEWNANSPVRRAATALDASAGD